MMPINEPPMPLDATCEKCDRPADVGLCIADDDRFHYYCSIHSNLPYVVTDTFGDPFIRANHGHQMPKCTDGKHNWRLVVERHQIRECRYSIHVCTKCHLNRMDATSPFRLCQWRQKFWRYNRK